MIFQHTIDKVLSGEKTQTRRIVKPGDELFADDFDPDAVMRRGFSAYRKIFEVGNTYAIQPGRGKAAVARMRITDIRRQDVREIDAYDARAEGFETWMLFLDTWLSMHDKPMLKKWEHWIKRLEDRPAERYQAWALTFEVVK